MPGHHPSDVPSVVDINASMPSLHMAWSWWCSSMLRRLGRRDAARAGRRPGRWADLAPLAIPAVVAADVVFTGNHYLLDVVAGVLLSAVVTGLVLHRLRDPAATGCPPPAG